MANFYITFGQDHRHEIGNIVFDKDCVAIIQAEDYNQARHKALVLFGPKFSFQYGEDDWDHDNMKYYPRGYLYTSSINFIIYQIEDEHVTVVVIAASEKDALEMAYDDPNPARVYTIKKIGVVTADVYDDVEPGVVCVSDDG